MIFILVHLPGLWGFWDGPAANYMRNRNVLLSVARGWFIGIVIGVIFPFVSSSGIFCPCSKQKINFKNPVEPVTCKSSEWSEVQWKLKQLMSGVGEAGMNLEFGLSPEELSEAAMPWALGVTIPKPACQIYPRQQRGSGTLRQEQEDRLVGMFGGGAPFSPGILRVAGVTSSRSDLELPRFQVCRKAFSIGKGKRTKCCQLGDYTQGITAWKLTSHALVVSFWADLVLGLSALMQCISRSQIKEWAGEILLE